MAAFKGNKKDPRHYWDTLDRKKSQERFKGFKR